MRLINTSSITVKEFIGDAVPPYAILSHTWENEEVTLQDITSDIPVTKSGLNKIKSFCEQASRDGFDWGWVDTCCINKESSAELSEAINSMFRWYEKSQVCYVYLADVQSSLRIITKRPRWFTRGWTLQELLAPADVEFFDREWQALGSKRSLVGDISAYTGIPQQTLLNPELINMPYMYSVAEKFSWAAGRQTTRIEDRAYSLLGLMDVNMALLYGEGERAFHRLQKKVLKATSDPTIFAWSRYSERDSHNPECVAKLRGLLAQSPDDFGLLRRVHFNAVLREQPTVTTNNVKICLPCLSLGRGRIMASLQCWSDHGGVYLTLVQNMSGRWLRFEEAAILEGEGAYQPQNLNVGSEIMEFVEHEFGTTLQTPMPLVSLPTLSIFAVANVRGGTVESQLVYLRATEHEFPEKAPGSMNRAPGTCVYRMLGHGATEDQFASMLWTKDIPCQANRRQLLAVLKPEVTSSTIGGKNSGDICEISLYRGGKSVVDLLISISGMANHTRVHVSRARVAKAHERRAAGPVSSWDALRWSLTESSAHIPDRYDASVMVDGKLYMVFARARKHGKGPAGDAAAGPHHHVDIVLTESQGKG